MSAPVASLSDAIQTVRANPTYIGITAAVLLLGIITATIISFIPVLNFISNVIIATAGAAIIGGVAAGTKQSPSGDVTFADVKRTLETHTKTLVGSYIGITLVYLVFAIGFAIILVATVGLGGVATSAGPASAAESTAAGAGSTLLFTALFILFPLVIAAVSIPLQFLNVTIIIGDQDVIGSWRESFRLTLNNPLSVLGYTLLRAAVAAISGIAVLVIAAGAWAVNEILGGLLVVILFPAVSAVVATVNYSHHVHYYRRLTGRRETA